MKSRERGGIILWAILIILALILLKYFLNWDIFDAAASDQGQSTILYIRKVFNAVWDVIAAPVLFIWNGILHPLLDMIWQNFLAFIKWGQDTASGANTNPIINN